MLQIAICEDTGRDALSLRHMVEEYLDGHGFEGRVDIFRDGESFLEAFRAGVYQIVFLDIYLGGGLDGMQTARGLRAQDEELEIIFLTVSEAHAIESYAVRATHYLPKPAVYSQLCEAMERCRQKLDEHTRCIEVYSNHSPVRVRLSGVLYIETYQRSSVIHTTTVEVKTAMTMEALKEMLGGSPFIRCHRSFIVNLRKIHHLQEKEVVLVDGSRIPVGGVYTEAFEQEYAKLAASLTRVGNEAVVYGGTKQTGVERKSSHDEN